MSKELIRLRNLCMAFDDELVLDNINLYINDSEFLTLLGPSGCGKTTTLRIIGGFTTPTSGDVTFDGVRINDVPPHKRQINTVFQKYALFPHLDVFENIAFGLRTPIASAEKIKIKHGAAIAEMVRPDEYIEVPSVGGREPRRLSRQVLAEICEPRMEEILYLVDQTLVRSGYKDMIGAGVVLTGGTALMEGCQELGEQIFNLPTRIGYPRNVGGLKDVVNSPKFSTAVGLLRYGAEKEMSGQKKFTTRSESGVFDGVLSRMKKWFADIS